MDKNIIYLSTYKEVRKVLATRGSMVAVEISCTEQYVFAIKNDFLMLITRNAIQGQKGPLNYDGEPITFSWYVDQKILYVTSGI